MRKSHKNIKEYVISYAFIFPYFLLFTVFTIIPVICAIVLGFTNYNIVQPAKFAGWMNYTKMFLSDDIFIIALKNTLVIAFVCGPVGYLACVLLAWFLNDLSPKIRTLFTLIFYAPSISGSVYVIWLLIFSSDSYGYLNSVLESLGLIDNPIQWLQDTRYILMCVIIVQIWLSLGTSFLAFIAGFQSIDRSLYESGAIDGIRNRWQELWYITLPAIRPMLMFGALIQITSSFSVGDVSNNLAGNPSVDYAAHTILTHIQDYGNTRFELGYACALATFLFIMMVVTNSFVQQLLKKVGG